MKSLYLFVLFAFMSCITPSNAENVEIVRVTPTGETDTVPQQIIIEFNKQMVKQGEFAIPQDSNLITISPKFNGQWRWLSETTLACHIEANGGLKEATSYTITIPAGIKAVDGTVTKESTHTFVTQRPRLTSTQVTNWKTAEKPDIFAYFNQPVQKESVEQHVFLFSPKLNKRISVSALRPPNEEAPAPDQLNMSSKWVIIPNAALSGDEEWEVRSEPGLISPHGPMNSVATEVAGSVYPFPEFKVVSLTCTDVNDEKIEIKADDEPGKAKRCDPLKPIYLSFTAPISRSEAANLTLTPDPSAGKPNVLWGNVPEEISISYREKESVYTVFLPLLPAMKDYELTVKPVKGMWAHLKALVSSKNPQTALKDCFGRSLIKNFTLRFQTDHRRPNYEFPYSHVVLEKNIDSEVPLFVNNLKTVDLTYHMITTQGASTNKEHSILIPEATDVQFAIPLGIRQLLGGKSGAFYGTFSTTPYVKKYHEPTLFAQVTPFQVNLKMGYSNSLVWVIDLATGHPVEGARVRLYTGLRTHLAEPEQVLAEGTTNEFGFVLLEGTKTIDPTLTHLHSWNNEKQIIYARVDKDEDMALLPLTSSFIVSPYQMSENVYGSSIRKYGNIKSWGITDQGIYRVGDTISFKLYVRDKNMDGYCAAPKGTYKLKITDPTQKVVFEKENIELDDFGCHHGEFTIPKNALVGMYSFELKGYMSDTPIVRHQEGKPDIIDANITLEPLSVLVSDFTPAPFKVTCDVNAEAIKPGQALEISSHAKLHAGGAFTEAPCVVTATLSRTTFTTKHPLAQGFYFGWHDENSHYDNHPSSQILQKDHVLDGHGEWNFLIEIDKAPTYPYGKLLVESAVQDDRGKSIVGRTTKPYFGTTQFVGLKSTQWLYASKTPAKMELIIVDDQGNPLHAAKADVIIKHEENVAARVKGSGAVYSTETNMQWVEVAKIASTSDSKAPTIVEFTPEKAGSYRIEATTTNAQGHKHQSNLEFYVTGPDFVLWSGEDDIKLPLMPEKADYKVGETARYLVKNPYPGATALITIERTGIIKSYTQKLEGNTPIIEIPVEPDYVPGVNISVTVFSPRVITEESKKPLELGQTEESKKPLELGQVDLAKPAYKMGYERLVVKDTYKEITVTAKTDREVYKPRETVKVHLNAIAAHPRDPAEPISIAVTVLDEAVFDLLAAGRRQFDPYDAFYNANGSDLNVENYCLLTRLVGRQHFAKKGANPGGDGGIDLATRDFFKFVTYWNPNVVTDANGDADIEFTVPDNLTGWRILAVAATPSDRFGLGDASFKVNRPTELRPVMPNQVAEGDVFTAGFSVMNRTNELRTIQLTIDAQVPGGEPAQTQQSVTLEPFKRATIALPITATQKGTIHFQAKAEDEKDKDSISFELPVNATRTLDVQTVWGSTSQDNVHQELVVPQEIFTDVGGITLSLSTSIISDIEGAFAYMKTYPHLCWEQRLSRGCMASLYQALKAYVPESFVWTESQTLSADTLKDAITFQAPNGGMGYFKADDGYADPYLSAFTALAFHWLESRGDALPKNVLEKLQHYLEEMLKKDKAPDHYSTDMLGTTRLVALAALAPYGKVTLADIERYHPHAQTSSIFGQAHFVMAALAIEGGHTFAQDIINKILARAVESAGKITFTDKSDLSRILGSPNRDLAAALMAFTQFAKTEHGKVIAKDMPFKIARTIMLNRKKEGWHNTQENIYVMQALAQYSAIYEPEAPKLQVAASMNKKPMGDVAFSSVQDHPKMLSAPIQGGTLDIMRKGTGQLYYAIKLAFAEKKPSKQVNAGIEVRREYFVFQNNAWVMITPETKVHRGDLIRVDLYVMASAPHNFVVLSDPVLGGVEPLNTQLATASLSDEAKLEAALPEQSYWHALKDWIDFAETHWSFYHQELKHDVVRYYADYLPTGNYHLSYTAQVISDGTFTAAPARAEEMYDDDIFGHTAAMGMTIESAAK